MESRLLLNVVVTQGAAILELLTGEDKSLLVRWDTLLVLDLGLHVVNSVRWLDLKSDGLTSKSLDENLHVASCFFSFNYLIIIKLWLLIKGWQSIKSRHDSTTI